METAARILVVEDDADIACGTVRVLGQAGYVTALARGGEEALQTLPTFCPHLVLLDRQMPGMDGMEVCRRIKADPMLRGVSVVIISAVFTLAEEQVVGLESGADGFIARPIGNRELLVRVAAFVRIARLNRDLANENAERRLLEMELEKRVRLRTAELDGANLDLRNEIVERQRVEELLRASESKHRKRIRLLDSLRASGGGWHFSAWKRKTPDSAGGTVRGYGGAPLRVTHCCSSLAEQPQCSLRLLVGLG
jgi:DNA-binding response OmpR family regulator